MAKEVATQEEKPRKSKKKIIIIIVALLLLSLIGGGAIFWFKMREPAAPVPATTAETSTAQSNTTQNQQTVTDIPRSNTQIVPLPVFTVNLSDAATTRYLKVGMEIELSSPEAAQEIQNQMVKIRDSIIILLSSKTYADLSTPVGKAQLKNEVASRINQILGTPRVVRVYFTEFVVQ